MVRALTVFLSLALLATVSAGWSQTTNNSAVVVGRNAQGQNVILRVIPLKFLDASLVAQLFGGTTVAGGSLAGLSGQGYDQQSGYTRRSHDPYNRNNRNNNLDSQSYNNMNNQGYGGYQQYYRPYQ